MIRPYLDKKYILIDPSKIADIAPPEFGIGGRRSEEEYIQLIKDSQEYFKRYIENPNEHSFWIYERCDAAALYINMCNAITVKKINNKYKVVFNGRHRLYVAKKYNLPILVCCFREDDSSVFEIDFRRRSYFWINLKRSIMNFKNIILSSIPSE